MLPTRARPRRPERSAKWALAHLTRTSLGWGIGTETLQEMGGHVSVMAGPFQTEDEAAAAYCHQVVAGSYRRIPLANDADTFEFTDGKRHNVSRMKEVCYICEDPAKNLPKAHCG